jgi:hypothetical protein
MPPARKPRRRDHEKGEVAMGKTVENPKKNIVSCRVDDDEMQVLQELASHADLSISMLLRHSLDLLQANLTSEMRLSA